MLDKVLKHRNALMYVYINVILEQRSRDDCYLTVKTIDGRGVSRLTETNESSSGK